jgi:hypothetical protein
MTAYNQAGFLYNQVGAIYDQSAIERTATGSGLGDSTTTSNFFSILTRTATGSGTGTSNNTIVLGLLRTAYGSGGATAGDTADWNINPARTATGTGQGTETATRVIVKVRTASGSGNGVSTANGLHIAPRTATGSGTGTQTATRVLVAIRTATGQGTSAGSALGAIIFRRTADGSGQGADTPSTWEKSHIFRVPYTYNYPGGYFGGGDSANRLGRYDRSNVRARNLYKLKTGEYTIVDQRDLGQVEKLWHGGRLHFLDDAEVAELTAAGFGDSIT